MRTKGGTIAPLKIGGCQLQEVRLLPTEIAQQISLEALGSRLMAVLEEGHKTE